jgi:hypothetical protein
MSVSHFAFQVPVCGGTMLSLPAQQKLETRNRNWSCVSINPLRSMSTVYSGDALKPRSRTEKQKTLRSFDEANASSSLVSRDQL